MNPSVYGTDSRAVPRWVVTAMMLKSCIEVALLLLFREPGPRTELAAPGLLRLPYEFKGLAVSLAALAAFAFIQFGRRRSPLMWGAIGIVMIGYLAHSQAVLTGSSEKELFLCGAIATGWLFGLACSRELDRMSGRPGDPDRADTFGEAGAGGTIAAIYACAASSKLIESGVGWGDGGNMLAAIVNRRTFSSEGSVLDSYLQFILNHPRIAGYLSVFTLCVQAAMVFYAVSRKFRMIWPPLVIGFHLNAFLLMGVKYFSPIIFLIAFSYPWPRIVRSLRRLPSPESPAAPEDDEATVRELAIRGSSWIAAAGAVALVLWLGIHGRDSAVLFHENEGEKQKSGPR